MSTATLVDPAQERLDAFYGSPIGDPEDEQRALRLAADEFASAASMKGGAFVTARNRLRRLAHLEHHGFIVWRRTLEGPQPVRFVAQAICGTWILRAERTDWVKAELDCRPCSRTLDALLGPRPTEAVDF